MFAPLLASLAMAKEGEYKTILQVYVSSISAHEFLLGKIIAFTLVGIAECIPLLFLLHFYFGLSFVGDPSSFLVATVLYAFCVASFGTMVTSTQISFIYGQNGVAIGTLKVQATYEFRGANNLTGDGQLSQCDLSGANCQRLPGCAGIEGKRVEVEEPDCP
jgi:hypothetical protein